ncbi:hypothetical protein [Hyphomicrobium sp. ghe19]|uniref:hypothetical protein n=1 Tax=Hyphomicrobium sp. ghe19 TaxID=2682968 RepID=UPI001366BF41|nr:hypothetical protein HYPP_02429 [Hyphomicrobium sp. ghe19]
MNIYSIDVPIWATVYVKAESEEEAKAKMLAAAKDRSFEFDNDDDPDLPISGKQFDDPDLPEVSLSPAMTLADESELVKCEVSFVEEIEENTDE